MERARASAASRPKKQNHIRRYGETGCATSGRNGVVWVEKSKTPKTRIKLRDMGKRGVRHMGEMVGETGDVASGVNGYIRLASPSTYTR